MSSYTLRFIYCLISTSLISSWPAQASLTARDELQDVRRLTVEHQGRFESFETFCQRWLTEIGGPQAHRAGDPVAITLAIMADPDSWKNRPLLWVGSESLRRALGLHQEIAFVSPDEISSNRGLQVLWHAVARKRREGARLTPLEREAWDLRRRLTAFQMIADQELRLVPAPNGGKTWLPVLRPDPYAWQQQVAIKQMWSTLLAAIRDGQAEQITPAAKRFTRAVHDLDAKTSRFPLQTASLFPPGITAGAVVTLAVLALFQLPRRRNKLSKRAARHSTNGFGRHAYREIRAENDSLEPYRQAIRQRARGLCWDHEFGHTESGQAVACRIDEFLPELVEMAEHAEPGDGFGFEALVEQGICTGRCGHMDRSGFCPIRAQSGCCLYRYLPLVYDALEHKLVGNV